MSASIAIDGASIPVALKPAGRSGRLVFQARAGERLGFALTDVKFTPASAAALVVTVRQADGSIVPGASPVHCMAATAANPRAACDGEVTIAQAGPHYIDIDAPFSAAAEASATLSRPAAAKLSLGAMHRVPLGRPGQDARLHVTLAPGTEVSVSASGQGPFAFRAFAPDGSLLREVRGDATTPASLSLSGQPGGYTVEIDPSNAGMGTFTVLAKAADSASIGGAPIDVKSASAADTVRVGFTAQQGESVVLAIPTLTFSPDVDGNAVLAVESADGQRIGQTGMCRTRGLPHAPDYVPPCKLAVSIRESGRYVATLRPPAGASVAGRLHLSRSAGGAMVPGTPVRLASMQPGQGASFVLSAAGNRELDVRLSGLVTSPASARVNISVNPMEGGRTGTRMVVAMNGKLATPLKLQPPGKFAITLDPGVASIESVELVAVESDGGAR